MNPEDDVFEQIRVFLPKYLTPEQTRHLYSELQKFPDNRSFYLERADLRDQLLQGDGWRGFVAINFATGERKTVSGVMLSNSCDISPDNPRYFPVNVLFAPLIHLAKLVERLHNAGKTQAQIDSVVGDIRKQRITSIFYLPDHSASIPESVIVLDDIHAHPLTDFIAQERTKLFTLNQYAFYIFLIKLSIHLARFNEGVRRFSDAA